MNKKILIIDDDEISRKTLGSLLSGQKIASQIVEAGDGLEASLKISKQDFDLIICDNYMPKLSGKELITDLVTNKKVHPGKVIFLSGQMDSDDVQDLINLGLRAILTKPIDTQRLFDHVKVCLSKAKAS